MNLHEYQAKAILRQYGVPVPEGVMIDDSRDAIDAAKQVAALTNIHSWAVKAQIHAGGRGKGGGVKIAKSLDEVEQYSKKILGMQLITPQTGPNGKLVRKLLIEQSIFYPDINGLINTKEFYISILLNRRTGRNMLIYSHAGGMDIEKVADETPELIFTEDISPVSGFRPFQARRIAFNLGLSGDCFNNMVMFLNNLVKAYQQCDASLIEINPVFKTSDNKILAADAKFRIDDNSLIRQKDILELRDFEEEEASEVEAFNNNLNFVKLDGNVGCMVNGAGLAMATMDIIKLSGGLPANFLDVGGGANPKTVEAGFRIILKDPNVKVILINIFGGIVRCDRVAEGVVEAYKSYGNINIPVIVRLQGTNAVAGKTIIDNSGLKVNSASTLDEVATLIKQYFN